MPIQKAVRGKRPLRIGFGGPTGSGKTYTALLIGSYIAAQAGARLGVIDTENYSSTVYADEFDFDVNPLTTFAPDDYVKAMEEFERSGTPYVLIVDSVSHAWIGKDGALSQVDRKVLEGKDSFTAWRFVTPQHNRLIEKLINYEGHLIATLRSKMEYALEKNERSGRNEVVKLGMAPMMRDGLEYEFDIYAEIDQDHNLMVTKTRARALDRYTINKAGEDLAARLWEWSQKGDAPEQRPGRMKPAKHQLAEFVRPDGSVNWRQFMQVASDRGVTIAQLSKIAPGKQAAVDALGWLLANPSKTLYDLLAVAKDVPAEPPAEPKKNGTKARHATLAE